MGNPVTELDTPPQSGTWREYVRNWVRGLGYLRAFWGRRLVGGAIGLMVDALSEGTRQIQYQTYPGHSEQSADSLVQVGKDRDLFRFRGETAANWTARVQNAWSDYAQGGTAIQLLKVINQWGNAGWPVTWPTGTVTLVESGSATDFSFILTIPYGLIVPQWTTTTYGSGKIYGSVGFFYGLSQQTDVATLVYLVRKWKPSRSRAYVNVYHAVGKYVELIV